MKKFTRSVRLVFLMAGWILIACATVLWAEEPDAAVKKTFDTLARALQSNDRAAFVAEATDAVKQGITQQVMDSLHKRVGSRLKKGYEANYLCHLKQQGLQVHLWKVTFKDGGDDVVIRVALKGGKIDGFFVQ